MDERDARELSHVTGLTLDRARMALDAWERVGVTGWRAQQIITRCTSMGVDPASMADAVYAVANHRTPSPIGPLPKKIDVRWPPLGTESISYWVNDD